MSTIIPISAIFINPSADSLLGKFRKYPFSAREGNIPRTLTYPREPDVKKKKEHESGTSDITWRCTVMYTELIALYNINCRPTLHIRRVTSCSRSSTV